MRCMPHPSPTQPVRYLELLSRAVAHVGDHLAGDLSTEALAREAAMSPYHFHRMFRAYFGTTVAGYVTWRRLQHACELLGRDGASVLDVALAVGYESAQALAKAMRRELDTTPTAVRAGTAPHWQRLFERRAATAGGDAHDPTLKPQFVELPRIDVLTATGRGMDDGDMSRAAQQGFGELWQAVEAAGVRDRVTRCLAILPDELQGKNDQAARMWTAAAFDGALPPIALHGSLAWQALPAGRHAVFTHIGPYTGLHRAWSAIYAQWLPATGYALRDTPPFEHYVNDPRTLPPEQWRTDIHMPLQ
jgi:AraC family transcriptional regulator